MKCLSIDIETTGLNTKTSEILEVGLVAFDTEVPFKGVNKYNTLRILMVKNEWRGETYALNLNKKIIEEILQAQKLFKDDPTKEFVIGYTSEMAVKNSEADYPTVYLNVDAEGHAPVLRPSFPVGSVIQKELKFKDVVNQFLSQNKFDGRITVAGKNFAGFDAKFLQDNYLFGENFMSKFRHKVLDPGSMYVLPEDDQVPGLPLCLERAGLPSEVPHTAVDDAVLVIKCIQAKLLNGIGPLSGV